MGLCNEGQDREVTVGREKKGPKKYIYIIYIGWIGGWDGSIDVVCGWVEKVKFVIPHPVVNHDESTVQRGFEGCVWCLSVREDEREKNMGIV